MGFWSTLVVHRGESMLWDLLPDVAQLRDATLWHDGGAGGWQVTRVAAGLSSLPDGFLVAVRDATAAPALVADVLDSDAAYVSAVGVRAPGWRAWLRIDGALGHLVMPTSPFDADGTYLGDGWRDPAYERKASAARADLLAETPGGVAVAAAAIAWAAEGGGRPAGVDEVATALDSDDVFAEDVLLRLLDRLGLIPPETPPPTPAPGIAQLLRDVVGARLTAVGAVAHPPVRGERLEFAAMPDLRLEFDSGSVVRACGCGAFTMSPATAGAAGTPAPPELAAMVGRRLADAATVREGFFPNLLGVVLRFDDAGLLVAALDGTWVFANGTTPPSRLGTHDLHVNGWVAAGI